MRQPGEKTVGVGLYIQGKRYHGQQARKEPLHILPSHNPSNYQLNPFFTPARQLNFIELYF
jgi:hypothetical protein